MTGDFCQRTARRIRRIGYAKRDADRISRFCYVSMVSAAGAIGAVLDPSLKSMAGDGSEGSRRLPLRALSDAPDIPDRWHGKCAMGARAPRTLLPDIQRRQPAP